MATLMQMDELSVICANIHIGRTLIGNVIDHKRTTKIVNVLRLSRSVNFDHLFELGVMKL